MLLKTHMPENEVAQVPLRILANLGDAVCGLYEREKALDRCASAKQMHTFVRNRVNAGAQAVFLDEITDLLTDLELDLTRRARNLKGGHRSASQQVLYRKATAFEALIGYLYMTNQDRLLDLFKELDQRTENNESSES